MNKLFSTIHLRCFVISFIIFIVAFAIFFSAFNSPEISQKKSHRRSSTYSSIDDVTYKVIDGEPLSDNKVLVIPVKGLILTEKTGDMGFFDLLGTSGATYGYDIKKSLSRAAEDSSIKAVLLEINSPGGTVGGAKAISDGIQMYKQKTKQPVYSHVIDTAASGGYWAAATTDNITAETGSITGSIGVIMGPFRFYDGVLSEGGFGSAITTKDGISYRYFTAGKNKDTGSPFRKMTPEEVDHWQKSIDDEYQIFVSHISKHRKIPQEAIINRITALPYGNAEALRLGLIDNVGSKSDSIARLLNVANISKDDFALVREEQTSGFFSGLFGVLKKVNEPKVTAPTMIDCPICNKPLFLYDASFRLMQMSNE